MRKISILIYILFIVSAIIISSISVIGGTENKIQNINYDFIKESGSINNGPFVWENGMDFSGFMHSQWDENKQFDFYHADDFEFDEATEVADIHWRGGYWGENYQTAGFDWCISFYYHNSTTGKPEGFPQNPSFSGPYCFKWNEIEKKIINDTGTAIYYEFSVDLQETLIFQSGQKYWISIWAEGSIPPQSGWCYHKTYLLNPAVLGSDYFGFPYWTLGLDVQGFNFDMAFQLTAPLEPLPPTPPYINGPRNGPVNTELCWIFQSDDPNEDNIKYIIDWGDGTMDETDYNQSDIPVELCHTYNKKDLYVIHAYAEDETGLKGNESTFGVTIPRFKKFSYNFLDIFRCRFPNSFNIIRLLLVLN